MEDFDGEPIKMPLDRSVERQAGESAVHWGMKAAVVEWLNAHPDLVGSIEVERKVEDLIADVRCEFRRAPAAFPRRLVVEVQTQHSDKDVVRATERYHRFGYAVCWVFHQEAAQQRREAETALEERLESRPSLGLISLRHGELHLGYPVLPAEFDRSGPTLAFNELYIPTHHRTRVAFDHGDFEQQSGERLALVTVGNRYYQCREVDDDGQRTLPLPIEGVSEMITSAELERVGPVRGPP